MAPSSFDNHERVDIVVRYTVDIETDRLDDEADLEERLVGIAWGTIRDCTPEGSSALPNPAICPHNVSFTRCMEEAFLISYPWRG